MYWCVERSGCTMLWSPIIVIGSLHLGSIYGIYLLITSAQIYTMIFSKYCWRQLSAKTEMLFWRSRFHLFLFVGIILVYASGLGITAGAHRLWSHRTYKAKLPLQILLMVFNTMAYQHSVIKWSRDHRVHHKYSETDADPYNVKRYWKRKSSSIWNEEWSNWLLFIVSVDSFFLTSDGYCAEDTQKIWPGPGKWMFRIWKMI